MCVSVHMRTCTDFSTVYHMPCNVQHTHTKGYLQRDFIWCEHCPYSSIPPLPVDANLNLRNCKSSIHLLQTIWSCSNCNCHNAQPNILANISRRMHFGQQFAKNHTASEWTIGQNSTNSFTWQWIRRTERALPGQPLITFQFAEI